MAADKIFASGRKYFLPSRKELGQACRRDEASPRNQTRSLDEFRVWRGFLRTHRTVSDELNRRLEQAHDLTLLHYGVLITLVTDPGRRLRMTDLAERVLTSPQRNDSRGQPTRRRGPGRAGPRTPTTERSFIVGLTTGLTRLREAQVTHHACVRELLFHGLTDNDVQRLGAIYDRTTSA